jgi:glycosyltransferase involved in cell wall biosynthesis
VAYILTPITFGGSERVSLNFLKNVDRKKFEIYPILFIRPWEKEQFFSRELRKYDFRYFTVPVALTQFADPLRVLRVAYRTFILLKRLRPDLVHSHGYFASICSLPTARLIGIPGISTCHGFISTDKKLKIYNKLEKISLKISKKIIAVSDNIKDELIISGINPARITLIQNAVNCFFDISELTYHRHKKRKFLKIDPYELVIGYVGRLSAEKGLRFLIQAVESIFKKNRFIKLIILGEGPEHESLERLVKAIGLQDNIIFLGFQGKVEEWIPAFDIFVLPSISEGTPMSLLEAMSIGLPVIASSVGGVPSIIEHRNNGYLVPPGDFSSISKGIESLWQNQELYKKIGENAAKTIHKNFNINAWCAKIEIEYQMITKKFF